MRMLKEASGLLLTGMLLITISMVSCKSESGGKEPKDYHFPNAKDILSAYNADRPDWDKSEKTEGSIKIMVEDDIVYIEHDAYNSLEIVTYYLQTQKKVRGLDPEQIEIAEVLYLDRNLIINSLKDKRRYHFALETDAKPDFLNGVTDVKTFVGYGLGLRKVNKGNNGENVRYCHCQFGDYPEALCPAGGSVSLDCRSTNEDGSCKVTCSGQTFACCDKRGK